MRQLKEWKKSQVDGPNFNQQIYAVLNAALASYKTDPPHKRYNDARLVAREILDNIYKHNPSVLIIGLDVEVSAGHEATIKIYHDGEQFNPFDDSSKCVLLKQLNYEYKFDPKFIFTDSGRHRLTFKFDLSMILGGASGSV